MTDLVDYFLENGFSGLEWAGGLPGTLGGAIRGNAGAFGGEIKNIIREVVSMGVFPKPKVIKRKNKECDFSYRNSVFKKQSPAGMNPKEIIIEAFLDLKKGDKALMGDIVRKNENYRKERQPLDYPNIGSIFKNVNVKNAPKNRIKEFEAVVKTDPFPVIPAAFLISEAGLKGISSGGAVISPKHPNFIVNALQASSSDVKNLINLAKSEVKNKFEIDLEEEIVYLA
jgi:UDP-N-acetylmuramate dehydrogenase